MKNWLFINVVAGIVIFPWLVRNGVHFGFTINGIIGYTNEIVAVTTKLQHFTGYTPSAGKISLLGIEGPPLIFNFLIEIILHNAYLILGSGILFFILAFHILKRRYHVGNHLYMFSLFVFILSLFYILLTSFHVIQIDWKLMGRYVEPLIPLFILLGFISYKKIKYSKKFITSSLFILYLITIFLIIPPLNRYSKSCVFSVYYLLSIDRIPKYLSILDINSYLSLPFFNTKIIMFLVLTIIFLIITF